MADDPDALWRPGFDGTYSRTPDTVPDTEPDTGTSTAPAKSAPATAETQPALAHRTSTSDVEIALSDPDAGIDAESETQTRTSPAPPGRLGGKRRRIQAAALLIGVALVAGVVIVAQRNAEPDRATFEPAAGADDRRLPTTAARLWSTTVAAVEQFDADGTSGSGPAGGGDARVGLRQFLVDGRSWVVAILPAADDSSIAVGLDPVTGDERWRRSFDFEARAVNLLGVLADVAVIEQNDVSDRRLIGLDTATGDIAWELPTRDNGVHVILSGTNVVTRVSFTGNPRLTFIDPETGEEPARVSGRLIGTDLAGTWFVEDGRRVSKIDLTDGVTEAVLVLEQPDGPVGPTAVVDGRVIVLDDDGTIAEALAGRTELVALVATGGELPDIVSLVPSGGPTMLAIGEGRVLGITIVDDRAEIQWDDQASVRVVNVTDRGMVIAVSDGSLGFVDGADLVVIEPVTGERLANAGPAPGTDDLPRILGDGFVVTNDAQLGLERIGYDLVGTEQWRLASNDPIQFGDRVMVTVSSGADGYTFTGFGDKE